MQLMVFLHGRAVRKQIRLRLARLILKVLCDDSVLPLSSSLPTIAKTFIHTESMMSQAFGGYKYSTISVLSLISP